MIRRNQSVPLALCFAFLLPAAAMASQPSGIAAELITTAYPGSGETAGLPGPGCGGSSFETYTYFGDQPLDPGDTLKVEFALVPFNAGETWVTMDGIEGTFMGFAFANGHVLDVNGDPVIGLSSNRSGWNDVTFLVRAATQDFILTVNGRDAGPFPFADFCADRGGCYSANALRIDNGTLREGGVIAWLDTLIIAKDSPSGHEPLGSITFDACGESPIVQVADGVVVPGNPPKMNRGGKKAKG